MEGASIAPAPASAFAAAGSSTRPADSLSPGAAGTVFNPIVWAEFRRWRARPFTYIGIVLLVLVLIILNRKNPNFLIDLLRSINLFPTGAAATTKPALLLQWMLQLLIRPSTLLPLLMVWRALRSFRKDKMYKPFRTTFLTPGEFLWGIISIPFLVSAAVIVFYTGWVLTPGLIDTYSRPNMFSERLHPYWTIVGVIFEGGLNGAAICFVALYFGVRFNARLSSMLPVFLFVLIIQASHAVTFVYAREIGDFFERLPVHSIEAISDSARFLVRLGLPISASAVDWLATFVERALFYLEQLWRYLVPGIFKLGVCLFFWALTKSWMLGDVEDEL